MISHSDPPSRRLTPQARVLAAAHRLVGWVCFQLGRHQAARRHFEHVLQHRDADFTSYVFLGRIAYCMGDYAGWRRECEHARRTNPERFARLRHPFELFEPRAAGTLHEETGERATWRAWRTSSYLSSARRTPGPETEGHYHADDTLVSWDDFASEAERDRFRELAAIQPAELAEVDLDELARQLQT